MNASTELTAFDRRRLIKFEKQIDKGWRQMAEALSIIRDERLYRDQFDTFQDYCSERWGHNRRYVNRLIQGARVVRRIERMGPVGPKQPTEWQVRPLAKLPEHEQTDAWKEAVDSAPHDGCGKPIITNAHVERVVAGRKSPPRTSPVCKDVRWEHIRGALTVLAAEELTPAQFLAEISPSQYPNVCDDIERVREWCEAVESKFSNGEAA